MIFVENTYCLMGMSINIFPIFSEKTCLQMSKYLESYARWGLLRINIWKFPSQSIDPYESWCVICLQSCGSSCLICPTEITEIDVSQLVIMIETHVIAYFNRINEYFWPPPIFRLFFQNFLIFGEKVQFWRFKMSIFNRLVI